VIALAGSLLAGPATAVAATGGAGLSTPIAPSHKSHKAHKTQHKSHKTHKATKRKAAATNPTTGSPLTTPITTEPGNTLVSATGNGITVQALASAMLRHMMTFTGSAPGDAGKTIAIERSGNQTDWQWTPTVTATVQPGGAFTATWATDHIGQFSIRAVLDSAQAEPAAVTQSMTVTVYLPSVASWYGPTLYGHGTACGETLTRRILGVANKTLPCGENVALYYDGRTLTVPVIDRGPYIKGRRYDLTYATAKALGTVTAGVATIGAVSLPTAP
jgi:rare lipoprotein A (peptidoglycan hydrolase)